MRIFLAGVSGVIGRQLTPLLVEAGHTVAGTTRSEAKAELVQAEAAYLAGAKKLAEASYQRAIEAAEKHGQVHVAALSHLALATRLGAEGGNDAAQSDFKASRSSSDRWESGIRYTCPLAVCKTTHSSSLATR